MTCLALMACNALALHSAPASSCPTSLHLTGALVALTSGLMAPGEQKLPQAVEHTLLAGGALEAAANLAAWCLVRSGKPLQVVYMPEQLCNVFRPGLCPMKCTT
jgi:hypothetical protein